MSAAERNRALAVEALAALHSAGAGTVCICPGGRNAPLVAAFDAARDAFDVVTFFEERSAAFFALGRIRRDRAPAAVVTTSGTAAAELLPAMLEARYSGLPLVAVTADRPRSLRGTGAPQTIDQLPLFAAARAPVTDVAAPGEMPDLPATNGPFHLNICFDEPLLGETPAGIALGKPEPPGEPAPWMDEAAARRACADFFAAARNPLVMVSSLDDAAAAALAPWLASLNCPLYLEAVSQLREHPRLQEFSLYAGERILLAPERREACDGVLRIGGVPTPRFWRECGGEGRPVLHVSRVDLPGMAGDAPVIPLPVFLRVAGEFCPCGADASALFRKDREAAGRLAELLDVEPKSEAALVRALARRFPDDARVLLGNSLPVREWDLAAPRAPNHRSLFANRGVNGIDGLVSTALGLAGAGRPAAAVIGDLSALYDLAGLWPVGQIASADITLAVINNGGGKIFDRMFRHPAFVNAHGIRLRGWAEMFGWHYGAVRGPGEPFPDSSPSIVEVLPDPAATKRFADGYAALWR